MENNDKIDCSRFLVQVGIRTQTGGRAESESCCRARHIQSARHHLRTRNNASPITTSSKRAIRGKGLSYGGPAREKTVGLADSLDGKTRALIVADVAELLNVSSGKFTSWSRAPHPVFQDRRSIRFDPLAVRLWLRMKMAPASVGHAEEEDTRRQFEACS